MSRLPSINVHENVEKPDAYITAAKNRIKANRAKGARAKWMAESPTAELCIDFLLACGQFEGTRKKTTSEDGEYVSTVLPHPVVRASQGEFYAKMRDQMMEWGRLTAGQEKAVLGMIEKAKARVEAREAERAAKNANCKHVGTVGERRQFDLTVKFTTGFDAQFGYTYVQVMEDADGNVLVYKGSSPIMVRHADGCSQVGDKGDKVSFKATIKAHDFRENVPQTILSRPSQK